MYLVSPKELEADVGVPPRSTSISSSVSLEKTPQDVISKEESQQIEAKKLQIENKKVD